jgi:subtilisin family serine protease
MSRTLSRCLAFLLLAPASVPAAPPPFATLVLANEEATAAVAAPADSDDAVARKIHAQLRAARGDPAARLPAQLASGDGVLAEIRFLPDAGEARSAQALARAGAQLRNTLSTDRVEAWIDRAQLYDLARDADVVSITPARLARHLIGTRTSEGVAAGRANLWQANTPALNGSGVVIAVIDSFDNNANEVNNLQASSDWPPDSRINLLDYKTFSAAPPQCSPSSFGCLNVRHGNATLEIAYDVAPGANFRAYDTVTVGDWRRAIIDAANVSATTGNSTGAVRAQIISASLGAPLDGKGDGSALPGSIAEAAGWARNRGLLVVNAAGNEREQHWDGLFTAASSGNGFHTWSGSNTVFNAFGEGSSAYCIPAGEVISVAMHWNNWLSGGANRNYDLYLYRRTNGSTWESLPAAQSTMIQGGGAGQTPQEYIDFVASGSTTGCAANSAVYGVAVVRVAGTTTRENLEVFTNIPLQQRVEERSLSFPADSPNLISVGAINVATAGSAPQQPFSSEGPVLASGGGLTNGNAASDTNLKPDVASFDNVSTVSYGIGGTNPIQDTAFIGTSAATPHVAGMAALLMQRNGIPTSAAQLDTLIVTPLRSLAGTGSNDLGTAGRDYQYGYGRLRLQRENTLSFLQPPTNTDVGDPITPAVKVRVLDDEGLAVPMGLLANAGIAIGNDPNGGSAVLSNGGNQPLVDGVATWSNLRISLGGIGYTLRASGGMLPAANSTAFTIATGAPSALEFAQQPVTTPAGTTLPPITVRVEDISGNLVTSDNTTLVRLVRSNCTSTPVTGGSPVAVVNGIATFANVVLFTTGSSQRLQAMATGRSSDTSSTFSITSSNNVIFRDGYESCPP